MKIFIDTNILLQVALHREHEQDCLRILNLCESTLRGYISWHSISVFHFVLIKRLGNKADKDIRNELSNLLEYIEISPSETSMAKQALKLEMKDFEDALQVVSAIHSGCEYIITYNSKDFKKSPITAITPTDFLEIT